MFFPTPKTPLMMTLNQLIPYLKRGSRNRKKNIFFAIATLTTLLNCDSTNDFPLTLGFNALYDYNCDFHFAKRSKEVTP